MADLVIIEWEDSRRPDGAWKHLAGSHAWDSVKCASVGWLVVDDKEKKVLAPNTGHIDDASNVLMSGQLVIPTSCVPRLSGLNEVTSSSQPRAALKLKQLRS